MIKTFFNKIRNKGADTSKDANLPKSTEKSDSAKEEKKRKSLEQAIEAVMNNTRLSRDEAVLMITDTCGKLGATYKEYRKCRMWKIPEDEQRSVLDKYRVERKRIRDEKKREESAAQQRKDILRDFDAERNIAGARRLTEIFSQGSVLPYGQEDMLSFGSAKAFFGDCLADTADSREQVEQFIFRYYGHRDIDKTSDGLILMLADWLFFCKDEGYDADDYFDYEFFCKKQEERHTFISAGYREEMKSALNKDRKTLAKKGLFLAYFSPYVHRPWLDTNKCKPEDMSDFLERAPVFFAKKDGHSGGEGITKVDGTSMSPDEMYTKFAGKGYVLEGVIKQHSELAEFNPDTVNTIRIWTLADADDMIRVMGAAIRFGREGGCTDNYHQGGLCALVDKDTGVITTDAIDRSGAHISIHPDSGKKFRGFFIPYWQDLIGMVISAANSCKDKNRNIGWDIAITEDGTPELVEGNSRPGFDIMQAQDMTGRKAEYDQYVTKLGLWTD